MPQPIARPVFPVSVLAIMLFQVAALFARSLLELSLIEDGMDVAVAKDLSYLVVPPILIGLLFPYLKRCMPQLIALLRPTDLSLSIVLLSVALGLTVRFIWWAGATLLIGIGFWENHNPHPVGPVLGFDCPPLPHVLLSLTVMALMIPVIEEVINRGFILHSLLPRGAVTSVAVSALLFALLHPPVNYVVTFLIGVLLAVQLLNYGTLWAPVIAHATYNAAAVFDWDCFHIVWNPPPSDPNLMLLSIMAAPVTVLAVCLAIFIVTRRTAGAYQAPTDQPPATARRQHAQ